MKKLLTLVMIYGLALSTLTVDVDAQTLRGNVKLHGRITSAQFSQIPLTYAARTDMCETGSEPGCTLLGLSYLGLANTPPVPGTLSGGQYLVGLNTIITDPDFGTMMVRASDYSYASNITYPNCGNNGIGLSWNMGAGGAASFWAADASKILINNTGSAQTMLSFNTGTLQVTPSALCAQNGLGTGTLAFAKSNPHIIYALNADQESTVLGSVTSGACVTPELMTQTTTTSHATMSAMNPTVLMQLTTNPTGSPDSSHTWVGGTSGCVFTPTASPTPFNYANAIYQGLINDGGAPSTWTISWQLLFNLNYVSVLSGVTGPNAPYFPVASSNCMPTDYNANFVGVFTQSDDDTAFTTVLGDNGQNTKTGGSCSHSPGGVCTGPVNMFSFIKGKGCRVWNTITDQLTGDYGPTGLATDGQSNIILGTIAGTFTTPSYIGPGEVLTQSVTGAKTELNCTWNGTACSTSGLTGVWVGQIFGTPDATHTWTGGTSGATIAPSGVPTAQSFYYPALVHDANGEANAAISSVTYVQPSNGNITTVAGNISTHQTTITMNNGAVYNPGQQILFFSLAGADDQYLNCTSANVCPIWTVATGTSSNVLVITDTVVAGSNYSDSENPLTAKLSPNGNGRNGNFGFYSAPVFWTVQGLAMNTCIDSSCQGHSAEGAINSYRAKFYTAHNVVNPSLPCQVTGPLTPCPGNQDYPLLVIPISNGIDQHGTYNNHGPADQSPVPMVTAVVCGQATNPGNSACTQYTLPWWDEMVAIENFVARPSGTNCNYGSGPTGCAYRLGHTFDSGSSWNLAQQNAIGNMDPTGRFIAFPSDWGTELGCMDGTTTCWSSYVGSGPASATATAVQVSGTAITVTASNAFCTPGGTSPIGSPCGSLAEQITMSGLTDPNDTWLNNQIITITTASGSNFVGTTTATNPHGNYGPTTESGLAKPVSCTGGLQPCQRSDIWIASVTTAHQ